MNLNFSGKKYFKRRSAFTMIELLIYIAIFAASSMFLIGILMAVVNVQTRSSSSAEVDNQISFLAKIVQDRVRNSSLIDIPLGVSTTTLKLRMPSAALDPTILFSSGSLAYVKEGVSEPVVISVPKVLIDDFSFTTVSYGRGSSGVRVNIAVSYDTTNPGAKARRTTQSVVARISAASFDSNLLPIGGSLNVGGLGSEWQNGYFSGGIGIGAALPSTPARLKISGDIVFSDSVSGVIFKTPAGNCFRLTMDNDLRLATTSLATCP